MPAWNLRIGTKHFRARRAPGQGPSLSLFLFLALFLLAGAAAPLADALSARSLEQRRALRILHDTAALVEENYAELPDLRKVYAAGLFGLKNALGKNRFEVKEQDARRYTLRLGEAEHEVRLGSGSKRDLESFTQAYLFALSREGDLRPAGGDITVMYKALKGMVRSLDDYSTFLTPEDYRNSKTETTGRYGGIGATVSLRDKKIVIVTPMENAPAAKAGLLAGDEIVAVDGFRIFGLPLRDSVKRLRGPADTKVRLLIDRKSWLDPREFTLTRELILLNSVRSKRLKGVIAYLQITSFQQRTAREVNRHLARFDRETLRGIILDLRNNPGGLLRQSVRVAEQFLPEGSLVVFTRGRHRDQFAHFRTQAHGAWHTVPLIVLVNRGSASAAEIVAGALQDLDRALILGETTFGKGSVQTIIQLSGGAGLRLTTSKYYTPSGREIHKKGVRPEVEMKNPARPGPAPAGRGSPIPKTGEADPQMEVAIRALKEAYGGTLEDLRLAAIRHRAPYRKGVPKAKVPQAGTTR
ncbi:MAG: S41 family peptidase [Nitrospinota bacterium]|nr:S41 family peptidase [Nitrospinota bacterium]